MSTTQTSSAEAPAGVVSRADLTAFLADMSAAIGADHYMLLSVVHDRDSSDSRIIASNWIYDAIQLVGLRRLAAMALSGATVLPGQPVRPVVGERAPASGGVVDAETASLLQVLGHGEIYGLRLHVGRQRYYLLLSSEGAGQVDPAIAAECHLPLCYGLSRMSGLLAAASLSAALTDRERECMFWVSEGKTTDEIAIILNVSANTANSYIANAIQKLGSSNRAMAMATAIRSGVI